MNIWVGVVVGLDIIGWQITKGQGIGIKMCKIEKYGSFRIDPCIKAEIDKINTSPQYYTILSCLEFPCVLYGTLSIIFPSFC